MKALKALFPLITLFIFICCSDDNGYDNLQYYEITAEFKSYTLFADGSSWTYENQETGETAIISIDSTLNYMGVNSTAKLGEYKYDAYEQFINQPNGMNYSKWEVSATNHPEMNSQMTSLLRLFYIDRYYIALQPNFYFGDTIHLGTKEGDYVNVEFLPQLNIDGNNFSSVYHSRTYDSLNEPRTLDFYVARNFGIIRQEIRTQNDTTIWKLVSWEINQ